MRCHVTLDLGFKLSHMLAARHQVGDFFAAFVALAEIGGLGPFDEHGEMVANREGMNNIVGDENHCDALQPDEL